MENEIKLFTKHNCPQCVHAERVLGDASVEYVIKCIDDLQEACEAIGMDVKQIKSAPVMIQGENIWTGEDCVVAVEEGELA